MTLQELYDRVQAMLIAAPGDARVLIDTEARTFHVHMVGLKSIDYDAETCKAAGIDPFIYMKLDV